MTKEALRVRRRYSRQRSRNRAPRPKTFHTEEAAKQWAQAQGYKEFHLENLRSPESKTKKLRVVVEV